MAGQRRTASDWNVEKGLESSGLLALAAALILSIVDSENRKTLCRRRGSGGIQAVVAPLAAGMGKSSSHEWHVLGSDRGTEPLRWCHCHAKFRPMNS